MRLMSEDLWDVWSEGRFVGNNKPLTRAVIQKSVLRKMGPWRSLLFGQDEPWYEVPNIKSCTIDSRLGSDAAQMTLVILNQAGIDTGANLDLTHAGETPSATDGPSVRELKDLGKPGYYSWRRGVTPVSQERWGHEFDPVWMDMFIPNRLIRTFQGYGSDGAVEPWNDTRLVLTGTWLIDTVEYSTSGHITVTCRDLAKLLIEQRIYPPIVPIDQYPLEICADYVVHSTKTVQTVEQEAQAAVQGGDVGRHIPKSQGYDSSVTPWYGYNASVYGHRASHTFDDNSSSYWLSVGNNGPNELWSYEWIGADCRGEPVNRVRFRPKWGGYVCYVGVKENGKWQGSSKVPYGYWTGPAYPNGSNIYYVKKVNIPKSEAWFNIDLPRVYNADQVRLVFTNLQNSGLGSNPYRAAVYDMEVLTYTAAKAAVIKTEEVPTETLVPGNLDDYTDIVKVFAGWSGLYWPYGPSDQVLRSWEEDLTTNTDSTSSSLPAVLVEGKGRIWGDFAYSGAYPVDPACIPTSFWDNKSVMDGINQIKEILGFICYMDASGGIIWRMPNIWRTGNYVLGYGHVGVDSVRTVDEQNVLIDYGATVDDLALRSEIHVVSADDPTLHTSISPGWSQGEVIPSAVDPRGDLALLGGQERVMLVPNYPFVSQKEVDKFAYLVSLWIHWSYRKSKFRIPGNPAFEPDDQIRIFERMTSEAYVHYIQGISSQMDLDAGTWYLDVDTHWLGNGPDSTWVVETYQDMPPALYAYLVAIGEIDEDGDPNNLPEGFDPDFEIPQFEVNYPRVDDDFSHLFPLPPDILYPYDDTTSDQDIAADVGSDYVSQPTSSGGGSVNHRSAAWRFTYWGKINTDQTTITFMRKGAHPNQTSDIRITCHRAAVPAYRLLAKVLTDYDYPVLSGTASLSVRYIAGTTTWSAHAWGLALDVNPRWNGTFNDCCDTSWSSWYGRTWSPQFAAAAFEITKKIRTKNSGVRVFGWGGYWKNKKDYMHFEVIATKQQLLEGVKLIL